MLKCEKTSVMNFENSIRGARNPMNSHHLMDSHYDENGNYILGENDLRLAVNLRKAGSDHRKYLRQIFVSVDITSSLYFFKEFDTYKIGTVANSTSTMHKIHSKTFTIEDFSYEHLSDFNRNVVLQGCVIPALNNARDAFLETKNKDDWWQMIQLLPSSYNQTRTVTMNYENLINIYHARKHHKLDEWHTLCDWIKTLPYAKELIICEEE